MSYSLQIKPIELIINLFGCIFQQIIEYKKRNLMY